MASSTQRTSSDETSREMDSDEQIYMVEPLNSRPPYVGRPIYITPFPSFQPPLRPFLSPQPLNSIPPLASPFMPPTRYLSPQPLNSISPYVTRSIPHHPLLSPEFLNRVPPFAGEPLSHSRFPSPHPLNSVTPQVSQPISHQRFLSSQSFGVPPYASQAIPSPSFSSPHNPFRPYLSPFNPFSSPPNQFASSSRRSSETLTNSSIIDLPTNSSQEVENLLHITRNAVALTGSASIGHMGLQIGKINIGESEDSYFFWMSLPGVSQENFSCEVKDDGEVTVKGVTITGERIIRRDSQVYVMTTRNLCPPGEFSLSFQLPGPVDHHHFTGNFQMDGIFVGKIKKKINEQTVNADS